MKTTHLDHERVYELSREYVTAVFPGDHDERTSAVGFFTDDGARLANTVEDPEAIIAIAHRLVMLADEIAEKQAQDRERLAAQARALGPGTTMRDLVKHMQRMKSADVVSLDQKRGLHDPTPES